MRKYERGSKGLLSTHKLERIHVRASRELGPGEAIFGGYGKLKFKEFSNATFPIVMGTVILWIVICQLA